MSIKGVDKDSISIPMGDRKVLRELAKRLAELAGRPVEKEKARLWTIHNDLGEVRPLVFCDPENGWNEIIPEETLVCESSLAKDWEVYLRKEICWAENMKDDKVVEAVFDVPYVATESDWGMHEKKIGGGHGGAYRWEAPLNDFSALDKLYFPCITVDYDATETICALAEEIFDGCLEVRIKHKWWWTLGLTWTLVNLRGLTQIMYDMVDYPDELHRLMSILRDGHLHKLDFLEKQGLLSDNTGNTYVGSGGFGFTEQLPKEGFDGKHVRLADMWGFAESQETSYVSPEMFAEFILPYQLPILEKFGLNCYGCCEPLERRWEYIKNIPKLRRVSVSPWANAEGMAERLKGDYIYSYKPNPAHLAVPEMDEELVRKGLREIIEITKKNNCVLEIIMKDNNTLGGNAQNAYKWVKIAKEEAEA